MNVNYNEIVIILTINKFLKVNAALCFLIKKEMVAQSQKYSFIVVLHNFRFLIFKLNVNFANLK